MDEKIVIKSLKKREQRFNLGISLDPKEIASLSHLYILETILVKSVISRGGLDEEIVI